MESLTPIEGLRIKAEIDANDYTGAAWLASLYWGGFITDPGFYICPSSPDSNRNGEDIGTHHAVSGKFGSQTVSYAGMHYRSQTNRRGDPMPGALRDDFPPNMPVWGVFPEKL